MAPASDLSPAERLRAQIARMVRGNGLPQEAITVQSETTTRAQLLGTLDVRLSAKSETTHGNGPPHSRWRESFNSLAELSAALPGLQMQVLKDTANLTYAADQILLETNQGWALTGSDLPISHLNFDIGAKAACGHCKGQKTGICQGCNGLRRHECEQCRGRRDMPCPTCFGRVVLASGEDCTACRKQGTVPCALCQGQGDMMCRNCGGKGQMPCATCDARGEVWQQTAFHIFAHTIFTMRLEGEYDESILQHIRRLKPEQLLDGRAEIRVGEKTMGDGIIQVAYQAEFPVTQLQFNIANTLARFVLIGEKASMVEATPFMDGLLAASLNLLRRARVREIPAAQALTELAKIRFYRDALSPGKKLQELRRRYPFGINANILREVPLSLQYLLSILTEQPRMLAAFGFNAVLAIVMLYLAKTNASAPRFQFFDIAIMISMLLMNLMILVGTHFGVTHQTLKSFGVKPDLSGISIASALGKTGFASLGVSLALCLLAWALR